MRFSFFQMFFLPVLILVGIDATSVSGVEPTVHKDIEFASVDDHSLKLDLYLPSEKHPPLVIWIHGGGWRSGSKVRCYVRWLAEHGYAVASVSYRLTDKAVFPAQIHDCKAAVRWLRANAGEYGYRTDRIAVAGASAGGHLAALLGTTGDVKELEGTVGGNLEHSSRVDAIVDYYGATDFIQRTKTQPHKTIKKGSIVRLLLGGPADKKVELARQASPAFHVTSDDPPLLIFHGRKDDKVLIGQSERIVEVYTKLKLPVTLHVLENSGHGGDEFYRGENRTRLVEFLDRHVKQANETKSAPLPRSTQPAPKLSQPFLASPAHVGPPKLPEHATTNRAFQGIPSMAVAPSGRLWANWYAGVTPGEDHNNYVVVSTSGDDGKSWREVLIIDPDGAGPVRAFDPELWVAPTGRLFVFWAQAAGHDGSVAGVWCVHTDDPDDEQPQWSQPRRLTDGIMMCKPVVLSTGEWVLPASTWRATDSSARMIVSTDLGRSWSLRGACNVPPKVRAFDEHIITERKDGSLWLLARTKYGIGESVSMDRGKTWPDLKPSSIAHPSARFFVRRLNSGNLLLVKHGPIDQRTGRSHLTAYVSKDDGKSWTGGLLLDERSGVSYPDGQQTKDGLIRVIYDFSRRGSRHILMATFREEDVAAGKAISGDVRLRQLVSEASGGQKSAAGR